MALKESEIVVGHAYTGKRWKGDRKVVSIEKKPGLSTVHYIDLRTSRTGNAPLELFAINADGRGLAANS